MKKNKDRQSNLRSPVVIGGFIFVECVGLSPFSKEAGPRLVLPLPVMNWPLKAASYGSRSSTRTGAAASIGKTEAPGRRIWTSAYSQPKGAPGAGRGSLQTSI